MAAVAKLKYSASSSYRIDASNAVQTDIIMYTVTGLTKGSEAAAKVEAIKATGLTVSSQHPDSELKLKGLRVLFFDVMLLKTESKAEVIVTFGVSGDPFVDGPWVYEVQSVARTVTRGRDYIDQPLVVKYLPSNVPEANRAAWIVRHKREFHRGATVSARRDLLQVVARKQMSKTVADELSSRKVHPFTWPDKYQEWVNKEKTAGNAREGTWLMNGMRIYTRNAGQSFMIEASFLYNRDGHEDFIVFTDRWGLIPNDIDYPTNMVKPWPDSEDRLPRTVPYGVSRPQTLQGVRDFSATPLSIELAPFILPGT